MERVDEKALTNHLPDYNPGNDALLDASGKCLSTDCGNKLRTFADRMLDEVMTAYSNGSQVDLDDPSVYTGTSGIALLQLKLGNAAQALALVKPSLKHLRARYKDCTFLCGDCGPLAVAALAYTKLGDQYTSHRNECVKRITDMEKGVCESTSLPNEMLYGRAGYLYTLLLLQAELGDHIISKQSVLNVATSIVRFGQHLSTQLRSQCPLMYCWYDEYYTGAAHGHAGIVYLLIKVSQAIIASGSQHNVKSCPLLFTWHDKQYFGAAHGYAGIIYLLLKVVFKYPELNIDSLLVPTIDYLVSLQFPSGNFPSSFESGERDRLVHWCHGAPGFIYMLVAAYQRYQTVKYKNSVLACAEVVWRRGLLRKGYGICHGVSGNAYAFLAAYKLTGDNKYLHRAYQFALWCCDYGRHGCRKPDRPYSLFEGMAGTTYFLYDMLKPKEAKFPALEV